jgi:hypothetical protein
LRQLTRNIATFSSAVDGVGRKVMPFSRRHAEKIARQCKCHNLLPSVGQKLVEAYNAFRETVHSVGEFPFGKDRPSRAKIDLCSKPLKFPQLKHAGGVSAEWGWEESVRHSLAQYHLSGHRVLLQFANPLLNDGH